MTTTREVRFEYFADDNRVYASEFPDGRVVVSGASNGVTGSIVLTAVEAKALGEWLVASAVVAVGST